MQLEIGKYYLECGPNGAAGRVVGPAVRRNGQWEAPRGFPWNDDGTCCVCDDCGYHLRGGVVGALKFRYSLIGYTREHLYINDSRMSHNTVLRLFYHVGVWLGYDVESTANMRRPIRKAGGWDITFAPKSLSIGCKTYSRKQLMRAYLWLSDMLGYELED